MKHRINYSSLNFVALSLTECAICGISKTVLERKVLVSPNGRSHTYTHIHTYIKNIYMALIKATVSERLGLKSH